MFMHLGAVHFAYYMVLQLWAGRRIERVAGFLRVALIYWISGIGGPGRRRGWGGSVCLPTELKCSLRAAGWVVSGIFSPYTVGAGPSGAVYGLLGVLFVELFQSWPIVSYAWL